MGKKLYLAQNVLEISGKVQWSTLFPHHKTAIFIFTYEAYNNGLSSILTISLVIVDANGDKPQTKKNFAWISIFTQLVFETHSSVQILHR